MPSFHMGLVSRAVLESTDLKRVHHCTKFSLTAMPKHTVSAHSEWSCFRALSLYLSLYPELLTFPSSVHGTSNSLVSHLSSPFTAEDTEAQREQSPASGHRVGTWRKSARTWSFPWPPCSCHCPPGMEATPAPTIGSPFPTLYKALVPRKLYINHHFLPALARFVCGWDTVCVWGRLGSGLVFQLMQCFIQYLFSESSRGPGPKEGNAGTQT